MTITARILATVFLSLSITIAGSIETPTATASPAATEPDGPQPGTTEIGWRQLGLDNRMQLVGANQANVVSVPVPLGATPTAVTGQIGSVANMSTGRVDVLDERGILLGAVPIPVGPATQPFEIDTSAAQIATDVAKLTFVLHDDAPPAGGCVPPESVTLSQLVTAYSGDSLSPVTVADFLPGYLDGITIRVGATPSPDQQQAALSLVAKLTPLYRPIPVRIDVDTTSGPPPPSTGTSRVIEIRDGGEPGMTVEQPGTPAAVLAINGSGESLIRQTELFADRRVLLAQNASAAVTKANINPLPSTNTLTFSQLGVTGEAAVIGTQTLYAGFDSGKFGVGAIEMAQVHLLAHHTAVRDGDASVLVRSGSTVLASRMLDRSGTVDMTLDIPAEEMASNVGLALELRYLPNRGECVPLGDKMTFTLDSTSTVTVTPGSRNRGGFPVLPTAFTPDFDVSVSSPEQIRLAANLINLLGQQTGVPLRPKVVPLDAAAKSGSGMLVVTSGAELVQLGMDPPLRPGDNDSITVDGSPFTEVDLNSQLGVVQAFSHNGRMVLNIGTGGDGLLATRSLDYIRGLESRWSSLAGDVVATGAAGKTVNLTVRAGGPMAHQPLPALGWKWWTWATIAIGLAALIAVVLTLIARRRRVTA